ncbi:MAG: hypothetical protein GEU80_12090 [Dehalococcoidia bacterium]|nr:hypothetical protein [Dehalococcoidia bacterium]
MLGALGLVSAALLGCGDDDDDERPTAAATSAPATETAVASPRATETVVPTEVAQPGGRVELFAFSNSSPHISVIDVETNAVVRTADLPDFTSWTWNDDNNFLDGSLLWLGTKDRDTNEVTIVTLDLDTLEITHRIPVGQDPQNVYIGKALADGSAVHIGLQGSGRVVPIDPRTFEVIADWDDVPLGSGSEGVVCDADISIDASGVERFVYPTRAGDSIVSLDPRSGETLREVATPGGTVPLMLSTGSDGRIWVQDTGSNTNSIYEPTNLELLRRIPSGQGPIVNSFSPDGRLVYVGHGDDTIVQVIDSETYEEVARVTVGTNPQKLAVHPDGTRVYAILTQEASVAVIDTASWEVMERVMLGTNPTTAFVRSVV